VDYLTFKLQLHMMLNAGTEASIEAHTYLLYSLEKTSTYKVSMSQKHLFCCHHLTVSSADS